MAALARTQAARGRRLVVYTVTIIAFAVLLLNAEDPGAWRLVPAGDWLWSLAAACGMPMLYGGLGWFGCQRALSELAGHRNLDPNDAHARFQRWVAVLRATLPAAFAAVVFLTRWPEFFSLQHISPWLQVLADFVVLTPFAASLLVLWLAAYHLEDGASLFDTADSGQRTLPLSAGTPSLSFGAADGRDLSPWRVSEGPSREPVEVTWSLKSYLAFHFRHDFLAAAAPLGLVLLAANVARGYERALVRLAGVEWGGDLALGLAAAAVFVVSPLLIVRIWRTRPLEPGPLRERLEDLCARIGLRVRDIMVWQSEGTIINAAVMGIVAPLRFVLLSDALLACMSTKQTESVFGHEAGHVRHCHIPAFLAFALIGWLLVSAVMEVFTLLLGGRWALDAPLGVVGVVAVGLMALLWLLGFGSLSRRFERQADIFGAVCATPPAEDCRLACAFHRPDLGPEERLGRICISGAKVFASALDRVAALNGIPHAEHSWRHASIRRRIESLMTLAGDPAAARRFERTMAGIRTALIVGATLGPALWLAYWLAFGEPAVLSARLGR